jgi:hypothetical protein
MTKFQNYKHYKLPITINPLEYGKLLVQISDLFILQFNKTNIAIINQFKDHNKIKFYREGDLIFNYTDHKIDNNTFVRSLENRKFTFKNGELISVDFQKLILQIVLISLILLIYSISSENSYNLNIALAGLSNKNIFKDIIKKIENIYKNNKAELFILFEFSLVILIYLICFVIFPDNSTNIALAGLSTKNIIKLRKIKSKHS